MPMYIWIECSNNYSKTSKNLWQYKWNKPHATIVKYESFQSKITLIGKTPPLMVIQRILNSSIIKILK